MLQGEGIANAKALGSECAGVFFEKQAPSDMWAGGRALGLEDMARVSDVTPSETEDTGKFEPNLMIELPCILESSFWLPCEE